MYVLVVAVIFVAWALHTGQVPTILKQLGGLDARWLFLSAGFLVGYLLLRALTLYVFLRSENSRISYFKAMAVTGMGQFYSAITPSSSGGQPFEVIAMARWGVSATTATAAVSVQFICFQASLVASGVVLWIVTRMHVALYLGGVQWFVALGFLPELRDAAARDPAGRKPTDDERPLARGCLGSDPLPNRKKQ